MQHAELERVTGIEPAYEAWEAAVLPLNYTRSATQFTRSRSAAGDRTAVATSLSCRASPPRAEPKAPRG
jgi:hypothetical protein